MIPILYAKDAAEFLSNGTGALKDAVSCTVTEERNGEYVCTLQYPLSGFRYSEIKEGSIIKVKANETSEPQLFRIKKSSKPINGIVTFTAPHISYDLSGLPLISLSRTDSTADGAMSAAFAACPISHAFTTYSDKDILKNVSITSPRSLRNFLGGQNGSILDLYGGEFEFDNFTVKLHVNRGADNGVIIAYGKNLTDAKQERNIEACYTHLCPYATKTVNTYDASGEITGQTKQTVTLSENVIELVDPENIGHSRAFIIDLTDEFGENEEINETNLRTKANAYIAAHELTVPEVNITVSFIQIWDTPEYKEFAAYERVKLCDTVTVRFEALGIDAKAKVIKTEYDSLNERYNSITVGSARANLADTVSQINEKLDDEKKTAQDNKNAAYVDLNNAVIEATNKITGNAGGYVVLHPANYPSEILIMDTNSISSAVNVWRWNGSGLGHSSSGYEGPYGIAITADGKINANYITTGTLSAITVSGCTISGGTLNIADKFTVDSNGNIHAEGYIKATSGVFGNQTYNFTIGASGTSASLYCGASSMQASGNIAVDSNKVYIGTDGLMYSSTYGNPTATMIFSNVIIERGKTTGDCYVETAIYGRGISFMNSGTVDISTVADATTYEIAAVEMQFDHQYVEMSGTWKSTSSIAVVSDRNAKNTVQNIDSRYIDLLGRLTPRRFKYNDGTSGRFHTGFIAQEVKEAMTAAGLTDQEFAALIYDNIGQAGESWSLRYEELIAPVIAKINTLDARISALEA